MSGILRALTEPGTWTPVNIGVEGPIGPQGPQGIPGELTQEMADERYVNVTGDTMTGPLAISHTDPFVLDVIAGPSANGANATIRGRNEANTASTGRLTFFEDQGVVLASMVTAQPVKAVVDNQDRLAVYADRIEALVPLAIGGPGDQPRISFLNSGGVVRSLIVAASGITTLLATANQALALGSANGERARFDVSGNFLVGQTTSSPGLASGAGVLGWGPIHSTWAFNGGSLSLSHIGGADTTGGMYVRFDRFTSLIGTITQASQSSVAFNSTSHGPFKGDVTDLDDDEALARVASWRPVSFRWKFNSDGFLDEHGLAQGDVTHGFIAQELYEVQPSAVTPGTGNQEDYDAWLVRKHDHEMQLAAYDPESGSDPPEPFTEMNPFMPWMADNAKLVPDLTAAVQALIHKVRALEEQQAS